MHFLTDEQQEQILIISDVLNTSNVWTKLERRLDIELDCNSDIFSEIEEFILNKLEEMQSITDDC
tara:strand:- start:725 stop:919 length:195 start_codon:yes stop_codon:yes gene_type:complete